MKKFLALLLALVMAFSLVACGGDKTPADDQQGDNNGDSQYPEYFAGMDQLIADAQAEGELTVYGSCEEEYLTAACQHFEELFGIKVNAQRLSTGEVKTKIEGLQETATGTDAETLTKQMEAVEKALTLAKDKCQKMFESGITTFQGYLDDANLCVTNCGTRSSKLELIENRMKSQKTTFETLKSENEDIDVTETVINLKSAEMTYEAALMATGKVMQTTLLNFI